VRDQHDRGAGPGLELAHQVEDLRLDRDVQRGRRLVGDQEPRLAGERHRDHHPLPHPTGKLVRVLEDAALRLWHPHQPKHLDRAGAGLLARKPAVQDQRFGDLVADGQDRIQRRHRLLEDHGYGVAANLAHLGLRQVEQIATLEHHASVDGASGRRRDQAQEGKRRDAFAAAGLADDG
jgi:hypothetical protein